MGMPEIKEKFAGEWVLIAYKELDEDLDVLIGKVLAHSVHRDEIYQCPLSLKQKKIAIGKKPMVCLKSYPEMRR